MSLTSEVGWMIGPGSLFKDGELLLQKASQSVSLIITVMSSNKMSEKEKKYFENLN